MLASGSLLVSNSEDGWHLMLATLWRHVGHLDEAQQRLLLLEEIDDSKKWRKELEQERRLLSRLNQAA